MSRVVPDDRHRASWMGDGPDGYYHLCRVGCARGDGRCGGCAGWPRRRGPPTRGFRQPFRDSDEAGGAAEQTGASPELLLLGRPMRLWVASATDWWLA